MTTVSNIPLDILSDGSMKIISRPPKLKIILNNKNYSSNKWDKVFKNGPNKICGRQPSKNFTSSILE